MISLNRLGFQKSPEKLWPEKNGTCTYCSVEDGGRFLYQLYRASHGHTYLSAIRLDGKRVAIALINRISPPFHLSAYLGFFLSIKR